MSFWNKLVGGGAEGVGKGVEAAAKGLDMLFTSKEEKLTYELALERLKQLPFDKQVELNKVEAAHRTMFVAGWRPFTGWICGFAFGYALIFRDLVAWGLVAVAPDVAPLPEMDTSLLMPVLMGMLGLGWLRTEEKKQGVTK